MTWEPVRYDRKIRAIRIAETGQHVVRWDGICDPVTDWGQNNARLILCAPEMLELLEVIQNIVPDSPYRDRIGDVIAKVRGDI